MQVFLFGWAVTIEGHANVEPLLKLIEQTIKNINPKQILHIPFARIVASEPEWDWDWFHRHIHLEWVEYLNAANEGDIERADNPLILISGGREHINLLTKIHNNPHLEQLIRNAKYIIGESAGAKVLWAYARILSKDGKRMLAPWLWIIKDTIIEGHYIEQGRQEFLMQEMKEMNLKYGIGVDSNAGISFDTEKFPEEYEVIGDVVEVKTNPDLIW